MGTAKPVGGAVLRNGEAMYLRILKKDLKRKKTMNVILFLFIILATMFVASSVNNIITITTALDDFFEKADAPDYFMATARKMDGNPVEDVLKDVSAVDRYKVENVLLGSPENFYKDGKQLETKNTSIIMSFDDAAVNFFDEENERITEVPEGTILLSGKGMEETNVKEGDRLEIRIGEVTITLKVLGGCKDAVLGSELMGMSRFILNQKDYERMTEGQEAMLETYGGCLVYIHSEDVAAVEKALSQENGILFAGDRATLKMTYVMDMIIAGVLLVVSVCLILVAFVVLRFTITFTLSEEFREIGVMKAIGIGNIKIRGLYMVKYLGLAAVGAVIGFFASIPFGNMLLKSVSKTMVLENDSALFINLLCCVAVVAIILLFCFGCTRKVKEYTPIDAIRSGATGERFRKKSVLRLGKTPGRPSVFMAFNDILSSPKRFLSVIVTYTLCMLLVLILVNTANTLRSDDLITTFGMYKSDAYLSLDEAEMMGFMATGGEEQFEAKLKNVEETLAANGIPAHCSIEILFKYNLFYGDNTYKSIVLQGIGTTTDQYTYQEGTAPQNANEVAITPLIAEKLGAKIGDTITISNGLGEQEYIVTALYQSMNNLGEGVRLHEDVINDFAEASGFFLVQINYTDSPDEEECEARLEKMKDIFDSDNAWDNVWTAGEYVEQMVGVADMIDGVKILTLGVVIIIIALVTILMERSFIAKEQGEIATMKAIGFGTGSIIGWHTLRFVIVGIVSSFIAVLLAIPVTKLTITPIFRMMGAFFGVPYKINPLEVFLFYPAIVLAVTLSCALLTALYTRTITATQASGIE